MFYLLIKSLKELLFAMLKNMLVIKEKSAELLVLMLLLLVTLKMDLKLESDFPLDLEKPSLVTLEL